MTEDDLWKAVDRSGLRQEAALYPWDYLTDDQRLAVLGTHRRFTMLAQYDWKIPPQSASVAAIEKFLPSLERETRAVNRAVLIDGSRGSGKTVVLMRLLQFWADRLRAKPVHEKDEGFEKAVVELERREREQPDAAATSRLAYTSEPNPIVPIGFTQLSLLDESANLLAYLSGYLHQVIESIVESRGVRSRDNLSPWTAVEDSGTQLLHLWNQYLQAVAHASSDQGSERKKTLDPETWALELRDAEFRRRDISDRFYELMDMLVNEYTAKFLRSDQMPMFVIAIDDADLRPQQSVRLLSVIRQLNHPRIGFILTGDTDLFKRMLTDSYLGRLRTPLRALDLDETDSQEQMKDREHAARLARDVFDKVVPQPHRYKLPPLDEAERLKLMKRHREQKPDDLGAFKELSFHAEALPRVIQTPKRRSTRWVEPRKLVEYFNNNPPVQTALPPRLREVTAFREYLDAQEGRTALDAVAWLWHGAVDRADIEPRDQDRLKRAVRKKRGQAGLAIEAFPFASAFLPRIVLPQRRIRDRWSVVLRQIDSYELKFDKKPLPEEVTAAFLLASDVAADSVQSDFLGRSVSPNEFHVPFVTVLYAARNYRTYEFCWPLPDWDGFIDFEVFSTRWRDVLLREEIISGESKSDLPEWGADTTSTLMARLARLYLGLAIDVADRRHEAPDTVTGGRNWEELANQLYTLSEIEAKRGPSRRNRHIVDWARTRAVLLAAPESGLAAGDANELLKALQTANVVDAGDAVRAREASVLASVRKIIKDENVDKHVESLIKAIDDDRGRSYRWRILQKTAGDTTGETAERPAKE